MSSFVTGVVVPIVGLAPGFVLVSVYRRNRRAPDPSDARWAATALVASIVPHAIFLFWTIQLVRPAGSGGITRIDPVEAVLWTLVVVMLVPAALGLLTSYVVEASWTQWFFRTIGWSRTARAKTAWDWLFDRRDPMWLAIQMRNGERLGGLWDEDSYATLGPGPLQIYLARPYNVGDDGFGDPLRGSPGLWIDGSEIVAMRVYDREG